MSKRSLGKESFRSAQHTVDLVDQIIAEALRARASDIHFEPTAEALGIRFRIDGVLQEATRLPYHLAQGVVARVKIMAHMDVAEQRLPQDGRTFFSTKQGSADLRVATLPAHHGEKVVVRLLPEERRARSMPALGLGEEALAQFTAALRHPHGLILVTGPTGSGKTTTLYAALQTFETVSKNIVTVEDPIEYALPGINQTQVNYKTGYTFAQGLRAILRQDPDIILVGEIRDEETARVAVQAALTGHLVLSTLHTQDAVSAVFRLRDMGIPPYLLATTLHCVVAQRLLRLVCPQGPCSECAETGYLGRTGIFEVFSVTPEVGEAIYQGEPSGALLALAEAQGMRPLWYDAAQKVRAGTTTVDAVRETLPATAARQIDAPAVPG